jgi:DNA-binding CsgD family transcriptional regulator
MENKTAGVEALTGRQKEILRLISRHLQAKEVARLLNISERTVKTHTEEARRRLGVTTSRDAARLLAVHEAALGRDDRGTARPIGEIVAGPAISTHEHQRPLSDDALERSGDRLAYAGRTGQAIRGGGDAGGSPRAEPERRAGEGGVQHDRGDRLVDRRWDSLEQRLVRLNAFQWLGLIVIVGVLSAILVSGLIAAVIGTLEGLQVLNRQIG